MCPKPRLRSALWKILLPVSRCTVYCSVPLWCVLMRDVQIAVVMSVELPVEPVVVSTKGKDVEARFLESKRAREDTLKKGALEGTEAEQARQRFIDAVCDHEKAIASVLEGKPVSLPSVAVASHSTDLSTPSHRAAAALSIYEAMKVVVSNGSELLCLPTHELRRANGQLQQCLADINAARKGTPGTEAAPAAPTSSGAPVKKFGFASKSKAAAPVAAAPVADTQTATAAASTAVTTLIASAQATTTFERLDDGRYLIASPSFVPWATRDPVAAPYAPFRAALIRRCAGSTLYLPPVNGSVFLSECRDMTIFVACHQMRIKDCHRCHIFVWCLSTPVIELSSEMVFGSYQSWQPTPDAAAAALPGFDPSFEASKWLVAGPDRVPALLAHMKTDAAMDRTEEHFEKSSQHVDDFSWLKQQVSPHWRALGGVDPATIDWTFPTVRAQPISGAETAESGSAVSR